MLLMNHLLSVYTSLLFPCDLLPMRWAIRATASVFFSYAGATSCAEYIQTDDESDIWTGIQLGI